MDIYNFEKAKSAEFSAVGMDGLYQEIERAKKELHNLSHRIYFTDVVDSLKGMGEE